jgi:hypothetical protein
MVGSAGIDAAEVSHTSIDVSKRDHFIPFDKKQLAPPVVNSHVLNASLYAIQEFEMTVRFEESVVIRFHNKNAISLRKTRQVELLAGINVRQKAYNLLRVILQKEAIVKEKPIINAAKYTNEDNCQRNHDLFHILTLTVVFPDCKGNDKS